MIFGWVRRFFTKSSLPMVMAEIMSPVLFPAFPRCFWDAGSCGRLFSLLAENKNRAIRHPTSDEARHRVRLRTLPRQTESSAEGRRKNDVLGFEHGLAADSFSLDLALQKVRAPRQLRKSVEQSFRFPEGVNNARTRNPAWGSWVLVMRDLRACSSGSQS